jgi:uncharacterized protein (DUF2235 family)
MARNILVFADGTGNEGGLIPDESRTNVYKLYRAARAGPDSTIDPSRQVAFYIRGVGTPTPGTFQSWRGVGERLQQMIGAGLTSRMADCYAAIISAWRPGDRIYLFGFSRGAYTVRCLAHVLELVGIPAQEGGRPISLEPTALRRIAKIGVKALYEWGLPIKDLEKRRQLVETFRSEYHSLTGVEQGVVPYFIGVWDTVAALGWTHFTISKIMRKLPFLSSEYDLHSVRDVPFARHAMAIDEYRRDFIRVPWGGSGTVSDADINGVKRFRQVWFAGNHADIGGSYPENESRLSDITLQWMVDFISKEIPDEQARILVDQEVLHLYPACDGMMHDELMAGHGPTHSVHFWVAGERKVDPGGELDPSVIDRMKLSNVRNFIGYGPYRPKSLAEHPAVEQFYT